MTTGECIRHTQQLEHVPSVLSDTDTGSDLSQDACLLVDLHIDVRYLRQGDRCREPTGPSADNGDLERGDRRFNGHVRGRRASLKQYEYGSEYYGVFVVANELISYSQKANASGSGRMACEEPRYSLQSRAESLDGGFDP